MATWTRWLDRARSFAHENLSDEARAVARRVERGLTQRMPAPVAAALERWVRGPRHHDATARVEFADAPPSPRDGAATGSSAAEFVTVAADATTAPDGKPSGPEALDRVQVLRRVHMKAERGLKPEDRLVVIYATAQEADEVAALRLSLQGIEATVREMDLDREPQTKRQLAKLTGVMVPPYVYINGRYWGGPYDIASLALSGELDKVVANLLDDLGPEARRIGRLHETHSDGTDPENILRRWKLGHILCVDDLDAWYETDRNGTERFFYQGAERPLAEMADVAQEIARGVEQGRFEAQWLLEPAVALR